MVQINKNVVLSVVAVLMILIQSSTASPMPSSEYQNNQNQNAAVRPPSEEYMDFINARYRQMPYHLQRALRSNGKPTFIRFGKRSSPESESPRAENTFDEFAANQWGI